MLGTRELQRFFPLQRHSHPDATNGISLPPLPTPRFSQPFSGSSAQDGLRVYSTPQALPGFTPSKHCFGTISHGLLVGWLLRRYPSCMVSFLASVDIPAIAATEDYPFPRPLPKQDPSSSCDDRLPLWTWADLEALFLPRRPVDCLPVSPEKQDESSLGVRLLQGHSLTALVALPLLWFRPL